MAWRKLFIFGIATKWQSFRNLCQFYGFRFDSKRIARMPQRRSKEKLFSFVSGIFWITNKLSEIAKLFRNRDILIVNFKNKLETVRI